MSTSMIVPHALGAKVIVDGHRDLQAVVIGYTWRGEGVKIEVAWWTNGEHRSEWVDVWRIEAA